MLHRSARRTHHEHRLAVVARSRDELATQLDAAVRRRAGGGLVGGRVTERNEPVVFVFPGQGSQWLGMGRQLLESEPAFRARPRASAIKQSRAEAGWSVIDELRPSEASSRLQRHRHRAAALFAIQVALAALWRSWGVEPAAVVGHSMGEVAAAHVAGALTLEDAARVICRRSRLLRRVSGQGAMAVVELSPGRSRRAPSPAARSTCRSRSATARVRPSSPASPAQLDALHRPSSRADDVFCRRVKVDVASHSPQMDPLRADLLAALARHAAAGARRSRCTPRSPGEPIDGAALDADYWVRNLRGASVSFSDATERLMDGARRVHRDQPAPDPAAGDRSRAMRWSAQDGLAAVPSLRRGEDENFALMTAVAMLWSAGYPVSWDRVVGATGGHADLPAYPWQRQRFWFDAPSQMDLVTGRPSGAARETANRHPLIGEGVSVAGDRGARVWEFDLDEHGPRHSLLYSVGGKVVVPASTWLDLLVAAGRELGAGTRMALTGVAIEPLNLAGPPHAARLQVVARAEGPGRFACGVYRQTEDGWAPHVSAVLHLNGVGPVEADAPRLDALGGSRDGADAYATLEKSGCAVGAPLQSIKQWWTPADRTVAELALPQACAHEESRYWLHPSVIDAAFQAALLDSSSLLAGSAPRHPIAIARVDLHAGAGPVAWATAARSQQRGDAGYDVSLLDAAGKTRMRLTGLAMAAVAADSGATGVVNDWLYTLAWKESAAAAEPAATTHAGTWLVAGAADDLTEALTARIAAKGLGHRVADGDFELALSAAAGDPGGCAGIIFVAQPASGLSGASSGPARAALELATRLSRQDGTSRPRVWFVTRGSQPVVEHERVSCEHAAVWGVARTFAEEHPGLWGGLIDLDPASAPASAADEVFATLTETGEDQVAFRNGRRYALRLVRAAIAPNECYAAVLEADGKLEEKVSPPKGGTP